MPTSRRRVLMRTHLWATLLGLLLGACSPLKLLGPRQRLLSHIQLEGVEQADAERIATLYQQQPNSGFPLPKLAIYQFGRTFYDEERLKAKLTRVQQEFGAQIQAARPDSVKVGKLLVRREKRTNRIQRTIDKGNAIMRIGEPPVIYDSALTRQTVEQIAIFLRSKGFFRSRVWATDTTRDRRFLGNLFPRPDSVARKRVTVVYHVVEKQPFKLSELSYEIPDSAVARRVAASQPASLLRVGDQYDEEVIGNERLRLETLLKNQGYFDFRQQYITLEADTSFAPATVRLRTLVADPATGRRHHQYTIRDVRVVTDAGMIRFGQARDTLVYDSIRYLAFRHKISPKTLDRKITVRPGDTYSLTSTQLTQRQLANLDMFRFNTVNYLRVRTPDPADTTRRQLDAVINASPSKKYQETSEAGATYVALLVGPFANERVKVRNIFGGAEILEFGVRAGFEGQYSTANPPSVYTTQLGANVNLVLPQFLVPWRTNRYLTEFNPRTRLNAAYNYVIRPEYTRTNLEATYDYIWQRSTYHQYVFTPVSLSLVNTPRLDPAFRARLRTLEVQQGSPLLRSFSQLFVPSINFTSLYNSNDFNQTRDAHYLRLFGEVGGLTRQLYQDAIKLTVYNFGRFNADYRNYAKVNTHSYFVYRLNAGLARALTPTDGLRVIPYDKYFFAGGASSLRAWKPRRLGPGSSTTYQQDIDGNFVLDEDGQRIRDYNLEQPGEVLLEGNLEYRFPVVSFINGALFTDFGNVWLLDPDAETKRDGAQFQLGRFYRQIAVGSGIGIRFDFTFLILRLDIATKVYDPGAVGNKFVLPNFRLTGSRDQTTFNIGIGYPF